MDKVKQEKEAKKFVDWWIARGLEKSDMHSFWLKLLENVYIDHIKNISLTEIPDEEDLQILSCQRFWLYSKNECCKCFYPIEKA